MAFQLSGKPASLPDGVHRTPPWRQPDCMQSLFQASWGDWRAVGFQSLRYPGKNEWLLTVNLSFANVIPAEAVSVSPGNLSNRQILGPLTQSCIRNWRRGSRNLCFNKPFGSPGACSTVLGEDCLLRRAFFPTDFTPTLVANTLLTGADESSCRSGDHCSILFETIEVQE